MTVKLWENNFKDFKLENCHVLLSVYLIGGFA